MADLFSQVRSVDVLLKLMRGDMLHLTPYPFTPQKERFSPDSSSGLPRSTPEREGVSSARVRRFLEDLDACRQIRPHSVLIARHGRIIADASWKPYTAALPHMMYSLSKSVVGMAVGMAIREGLFELDSPAAAFFPEKTPRLPGPVKSLTVRHLLNMTAGMRFNEIGSAAEKDWVRACLQGGFEFEPGSQFRYNSMNSYLLSAILCKTTGQSLMEYLTPRLFEPLGIRGARWDKCPLGIEKGGWGLWLRPADMVKLGQLYLQKGSWYRDGKTVSILPAAWVNASVRTDQPAREDDHASHYGFQIWSFGSTAGAYQFNGLFGQYVVVLPHNDIVIALTGGSQNLLYDTAAEIMEKHFGGGAERLSPVPLPENIPGLRALRRTAQGLYAIKETAPAPIYAKKRLQDFLLPRRMIPRIPAGAEPLNRKAFSLGRSWCTLLPLALEGTANNFSPGLTEITFFFSPFECRARVSDGISTNLIRAGLEGAPVRGSVEVNGEPYAVGCTARFAEDEDGRTVLKLFVSFLETPFTRVMKFIVHSSGRITARFSELPSTETSLSMLLRLTGGERTGGMGRVFLDAVGRERLTERASHILHPRASGESVKREAARRQG